MRIIKISGKLSSIENDIDGWCKAEFESEGFKMESGESSTATTQAAPAEEVTQEAPKPRKNRKLSPLEEQAALRRMFRFPEDKRDTFDPRNPNPIKSCLDKDPKPAA